jgi:cysteine desulfurase
MWQKNVLYLDYNASAGVTSEVRKALTNSLNDGARWLANPSSAHQLGQGEEAFCRSALESISRSLGGVDAFELTLTSSGTESNQVVLDALAAECQVLWVGAGEHPASLDHLPLLRQRHPGLSVRLVPLHRDGSSDLDALAGELKALDRESRPMVGISLAWANNETGAVLDLEALSRLKAESGVRCRVHLDGAQAWGKLPVVLPGLSFVDYVTFSSHKVGAPAGSGLVWKRGGGFSGRKTGSRNALGLVALGEAARHVDPLRFSENTAPLRDRFEEQLKIRIPGVRIFGEGCTRVSNTSRFGFEGFPRYADWAEQLDLAGFAVSRGSACRSGTPGPSPVLLAMGIPPEIAVNSIRVSFGPDRTWEEMESFLAALCTLHEKKRNLL